MSSCYSLHIKFNFIGPLTILLAGNMIEPIRKTNLLLKITAALDFFGTIYVDGKKRTISMVPLCHPFSFTINVNRRVWAVEVTNSDHLSNTLGQGHLGLISESFDGDVILDRT